MKEMIDDLVRMTELYYDKWYIHLGLAIMIGLLVYVIYKVMLG